MQRVGIPREIKTNEGRVSLVPKAVKSLTQNGVKVYVETNAGIKAGYKDEEYVSVGANICHTHKEVFDNSDLIVKVKEPLPEEYDLIKKQHTVFTFFHFAGVPGLLDAMTKSGATCIAYETIQTDDGAFPILAPMSQIAGEEAITQGMKHVSISPENVKVTIIGAGNVGMAALNKAIELGVKKIIVMDNNLERLKHLSKDDIQVSYSSPENLQRALSISNLVVGAVYRNGLMAPKLITRHMLDGMPNDSVFVDVAIDQGGMTEESKPTTIDTPIIKYKDVKLYCVANMPGRVPENASIALSEAVTPFVEQMALLGTPNALLSNQVLNRGLNVKDGMTIHPSL